MSVPKAVTYKKMEEKLRELKSRKPRKVLDKGFVRLVDSMGDDSSVVQAARVSYQKGTKTKKEDAKLISYLMKNRHTTPFEMVEFKFHAKMPIFVARQWVRHRTANINEVSARYSVLPADFYIPEALREQDMKNKQGSLVVHNSNKDNKNIERILQHSIKAYMLYEKLLKDGVGREMARIVLPLNIYTEWYWKIDLHNLLNFLRLRLDKHAQYEIRVYAEAMLKIIEDIVPVSVKTFRSVYSL